MEALKKRQPKVLSVEILKERERKLKRESNISAIEAACITLNIGESKVFRLVDIQAWNNIRARLHRLKPNLEFETKIDGNDLIVKRTA